MEPHSLSSIWTVGGSHTNTSGTLNRHKKKFTFVTFVTSKPTTATPPPYCWWKNVNTLQKKKKGRHGKAERVNVFRRAEPSAVWWSYQLEGGRRTGLQLENGRRRESKCSESGDVHDRGKRSGESLMLRHGSALFGHDIRPIVALGVEGSCIF